jgi:hypothetical protein
MGTGKVVFEKDQKQRKIKYKKFTDDGVKKLHEAVSATNFRFPSATLAS